MKKKTLIIVLSTICALGLAAVSACGYAVHLDRQLSQLAPQNTYLADINISGMTRQEAQELVRNRIQEKTKDYKLILSASNGDQSQKKTVSLSEFISTDVNTQLDEVFQLSQLTDLRARAWRVLHYLSNQEEPRRQFKIQYQLKAPEFKGILEEFREFVHADPIDASRSVNGDQVNITPDKDGSELDVEETLKRIETKLAAFKSDTLPQDKNIPLEIATKKLPAEVSASSFQELVTINLSSHKLHLYKGDKLVKTYRIGCGAPGFETPTGLLHIVRKRKDPTWVNPDPEGWGINMPEKIGPGPGNPLGPRALDLNRPAIRIHGVSDHRKLGVSRSHGCINMAYNDVIDLFDQVNVGTLVNVHY